MKHRWSSVRYLIIVFLVGFIVGASPNRAMAVETKCVCQYADPSCFSHQSRDECASDQDCVWRVTAVSGLGFCESDFRRWCQDIWRLHPTQESCSQTEIISQIQPLPAIDEDTREYRYAWSGHSSPAPADPNFDNHVLRLSILLLRSWRTPNLRLIDYWNSGCSYFSPKGYQRFLTHLTPNTGHLIQLMPQRNENLQVNMWGNQLCSISGAQLSGSSYAGEFHPWRRLRFNNQGRIELNSAFTFTPCDQYEGRSCSSPFLRGKHFICSEGATSIQEMRCEASPLFSLFGVWSWRGTPVENIVAENEPGDERLEDPAVLAQADSTPLETDDTLADHTELDEGEYSSITSSPPFTSLVAEYLALSSSNPEINSEAVETNPPATQGYYETGQEGEQFAWAYSSPFMDMYAPVGQITPIPNNDDSPYDLPTYEAPPAATMTPTISAPEITLQVLDQFGNSSTSIPFGERATILWTSVNANECWADSSEAHIPLVGTSGTYLSNPLTTVLGFQITCSSINSQISNAEIQVPVARPSGDTCYKTCTNLGFVEDRPGCPSGSFCRWFHRLDFCDFRDPPRGPPVAGAAQIGEGDFGICRPLQLLE